MFFFGSERMCRRLSLEKNAHHRAYCTMYVPKLTGVRSEDCDAGSRIASGHQISGQFSCHVCLGEIKMYIYCLSKNPLYISSYYINWVKTSWISPDTLKVIILPELRVDRTRKTFIKSLLNMDNSTKMFDLARYKYLPPHTLKSIFF